MKKLSKAQMKVVEILKNKKTVRANLIEAARNISWDAPVFIEELGATRFADSWQGTAFAKTLEVLAREGVITFEKFNEKYTYDVDLDAIKDDYKRIRALHAATIVKAELVPATFRFSYYVKLTEKGV